MSRSPTRSKRAASAPATYLQQTVPIDAVVPYWRNPRLIPEEAVVAVMESVRRYGYQQPIVVDESMTIIIGHTRYSALRRLGYTEVAVMVTDLAPEKVKALRVLDNRVREFTSWDIEELVAQIDGLDNDLMRSYFPEAVPHAVGDDGGAASEHDAGPDTSAWDEVDRTAEFICPSCFHTFEIDVTMDAVRAGRLEVPDATA